ncbi:ErfK/YbiS/YcfS/YnhG family protein [Pseudoscardovia radai]|uniref:ErfK/YbiS/YcfS/YnhG family protein n=1 Tax=Pseudoscardovia radai TaxID=987066 RepID=A0A261EZD6_9BIFI|nr:L,D-transpeptidase [Pseudoscardovia radai]OZG52193.1 ErfK/YbiS/YcfS/YnhG family protein [Pseudoscardovia radai]
MSDDENNEYTGRFEAGSADSAQVPPSVPAMPPVPSVSDAPVPPVPPLVPDTPDVSGVSFDAAGSYRAGSHDAAFDGAANPAVTDAQTTNARATDAGTFSPSGFDFAVPSTTDTAAAPAVPSPAWDDALPPEPPAPGESASSPATVTPGTVPVTPTSAPAPPLIPEHRTAPVVRGEDTEATAAFDPFAFDDGASFAAAQPAPEPPAPDTPVASGVSPTVGAPVAPAGPVVSDTPDAFATQAFDPLSFEGGPAETPAYETQAFNPASEPAFETAFETAPESAVADGLSDLADTDAHQPVDGGHADDLDAMMSGDDAHDGESSDSGSGSTAAHMSTARLVGLILAIVAVVFLGTVLFLHFHYSDRVAPGVTLGSSDMGGMTASEARQRVETIAGQTSVSVTAGDATTVATLSDLGVDVNVDQTVTDLLNAKPSNSFAGFFTRISPFSHQSVSLNATIDDSTMVAYLSDAMVDEDQRMENATVTYNKDLSRFVTTESHDGRTVSLDPVTNAVNAALTKPGTVQTATSSIVDGKASITTKTATDACNDANARLTNPIVLKTDGDTSYTIPSSTVASWMKLTSDLDKGTITIDYDSTAITDFATNSLADKLNRTASDEIVVESADGTRLGVLQSGKKGVTVGDTSSVGGKIVDLLDAGKGGDLTVPAAISDFTTQEQKRDFTKANGDMWVSIDLGAQTLTVSNGSTQLKQMNISSGVIGQTTATGSFFVWDHQQSGAIVGEETNGTPQWETFFNGDVAIIGADWASDAIKQGQPSSHGCVYMSVDDAKWLYDNVQNDVYVKVTGGTPTAPTRPDESDKDKDKDKDKDNADANSTDSQQTDSSNPSSSESPSSGASPSSGESSSASPSSSSSPSASEGQ